MMKIAAMLAGLAVLGVVFGVLERFGGSLPHAPLFRRERVPDFLYWFFTPLVSKSAAGVALFVVIAAMAAQPSSGWFDAQPFVVQVVELLVIGDVLAYVSHRLFHTRMLWKFHAIHHSAEHLDWLSAARLHPVNEIGSRLFQFVPMYLLGFRGAPLAAAVPILTFYAIFLHANLRWDFGPLRCVIASPVFHRWHHTSEEEGLDRNFAGLFPWIDALFGTLYMPRGRQPQRFGVAGEHVPPAFFAQLAYPFRRISAAADAPRY